ncbi:MAG: glycosyltransferase [Salinivirgaceae bacterium]|nr:glycosyltransferase [Salinivirgaceae bacterium]
MAKVCFILNSFEIGGIERVVVSLANALSKYHKIDLFVLKNRGVLKSTLSSDVNVISYDNLKVKSSLKYLSAYLKNNNPKYLVTSIYLISIIGHFAIKKAHAETKQIVVHHALLDSEFTHSVFNPILLKFVSIIYNKAYKVLAVSKGVYECLKKIGVKNVEVMYNPIDIEEKEKNVDFEIKNAVELKPYFLFLGRLCQVKNIKLIIKGFYEYLQTHPLSVHKLVIIGSGPDEQKLKTLVNDLKINDRCLFLGTKGYPEAYLKNAELVLMASYSEAMPVTVMEAFAFNVPVVSTPARGCIDIFDLIDFKYHTNSFEDETEYCKLMETLISKRAELSYLSTKVKEYYSTDIIVKKWNSILQ